MPQSYNSLLDAYFHLAVASPAILQTAVSNVSANYAMNPINASYYNSVIELFNTWQPTKNMHISTSPMAYFAALVIVKSWQLSYNELLDWYSRMSGREIQSQGYMQHVEDKINLRVSQLYVDMLSLAYCIYKYIPDVVKEFSNALNVLCGKDKQSNNFRRIANTAFDAIETI